MATVRPSRPQVVAAAVVVDVASAVVLMVVAFVGAALLVLGISTG